MFQYALRESNCGSVVRAGHVRRRRNMRRKLMLWLGHVHDCCISSLTPDCITIAHSTLTRCLEFGLARSRHHSASSVGTDSGNSPAHMRSHAARAGVCRTFQSATLAYCEGRGILFWILPRYSGDAPAQPCEIRRRWKHSRSTAAAAHNDEPRSLGSPSTRLFAANTNICGSDPCTP